MKVNRVKEMISSYHVFLGSVIDPRTRFSPLVFLPQLDLYEIAQRGASFSVVQDTFVVAAEHTRSGAWEATYGETRDPWQKLRVQALFRKFKAELKAQLKELKAQQQQQGQQEQLEQVQQQQQQQQWWAKEERLMPSLGQLQARQWQDVC